MKKLLPIIVFLFVSLVLVGCASARPTITNSSSHEQEHTNKQLHSETVVDSTLIDRLREVIIRHDTVYVKEYEYIYKWRDRQVTDTVRDTLYINQTDSVRIPVEVEKTIAPFVRNSCIALWMIVGVAILAIVAWIVWKFATGKFSWPGIISKLFSVFSR